MLKLLQLSFYKSVTFSEGRQMVTLLYIHQ